MAHPTAAALLEENKKRHAALQTRRSVAQGQLEAERRALDEACAEAVKEFGTSDLTQLRALFESTTMANDQVVVEFIMALDEVENGLATVEKQLAA